MLAFPFVSASVLAREMDWLILPAALTVLTAFSIREPLVVLGRQAFVWREPRAESEVALRFLAVSLAILAASGAVLLARRSWVLILVLGLGASALVALAVAMSVFNRQRSIGLQLVSAVGLSASALVAWLSSRPQLGATAWWLWAVHSAYSAAAVLVVHARLDARVAVRRPEHYRESVRSLRLAYAAQVGLLSASVLCLVWGRPLLTPPLALAASIHSVDLWNLRRPEALGAPLRHIGLRALGLSTAYSFLVIFALW
jgi:hypothetical protein